MSRAPALSSARRLHSLLCRRASQHDGPPSSNHERVLVMGGQTSIARANRPAVAPLHGATGARADHRLDRKHQALRQHVLLVGIPFIGNGWWLVNRPPDPMPGQTLHHREALTPHLTL